MCTIGLAMADIELKYGPGSSVTILKSGLSAIRLKANLQVEVEEVESGMEDALVLQLGEGAGQEGAQRIRRLLQMGIRNLSKRHVKMSADLGGRTTVVEIPPDQPSEDYKVAIDDFCTRVLDYHSQANPSDT
jgi:hypothetical protein